MKYPTFHKVIVEDKTAKAIMQWVTRKQFLDNKEFTTLVKFDLDELKLRAGYADSLFENEEEVSTTENGQQTKEGLKFFVSTKTKTLKTTVTSTKSLTSYHTCYKGKLNSFLLN